MSVLLFLATREQYSMFLLAFFVSAWVLSGTFGKFTGFLYSSIKTGFHDVKIVCYCSLSLFGHDLA